MPIFGLSIHLSCSKAVFILEECVGNGEFVPGEEFELLTPIVIAVVNVIPGHRIPPYSSVEFAKDQELVIYRDVVKMYAQIRIEAFFED